MIEYAYVVFQKTTRVPYLVYVSDIQDLRPKALTDFDPNRAYLVKWEGSNRNLGLSSDYYPANIKFLSGEL